VLVAITLLLTGCVDNRIVVTTPTPPPPATTPPPAATTPSPTPIPSPTPTPVPTPLLSARGGILVKEPLANTKVRSPLTIGGEAMVFEATLIWQVTDTAGRMLASGFTTATAGAPAKGTFTITATYTDPPSDIIGFAEVYTRSPQSGLIDEIVRVPLILAATR
jgi:immunoglobulin-like protein involved in spore germination